MHPGLPAALPATPRPGHASPGHRSLGAQGDARDLRATARDGHLGGLTPPVDSGRTRETSLNPNTKALPLRPPRLPSDGSCPGGKRTPLRRLTRRSPIVSDRLRSPTAHTSRRRPPSPTPRSADRAASPTRNLWISASGPRSAQTPLGPAQPSPDSARLRTQIRRQRAGRPTRATPLPTLPSARARRPWDCIIACAEGRG